MNHFLLEEQHILLIAIIGCGIVLFVVLISLLRAVKWHTESFTESIIKRTDNESEPDTGRCSKTPRRDYKSLFLATRPAGPKIQTYIDRSIHNSIKKTLRVISTEVSITTYINNVLQQHLEDNREEIKEMMREKIKQLNL